MLESAFFSDFVSSWRVADWFGLELWNKVTVVLLGYSFELISQWSAPLFFNDLRSVMIPSEKTMNQKAG